MTVENLLQRLQNVIPTGHQKWKAACPAHQDNDPSLTIRLLDDGRILMHCFAGCDSADILSSIGVDFSALYPAPLSSHLPRVRKPWSANDVLGALALEVLYAWNYANKMSRGEVLTDAERERLLLCAIRLQRGWEIAHG